MADYSKQYTEIFDYLSAPKIPSSPESTVVFGRNDPRVARSAGDLILAHLAPVTIITGGIGKDSGDILKLGFKSEAAYLKSELSKDAAMRGYSPSDLTEILLDEEAANGGDNARNSINILNKNGYDSDTITAVAHATSARRLAEMLKAEAVKINGQTPDVYIKPTDYEFDARNIADQQESTAELLRLADWPERNWLPPQSDLPQDLVEFARERGTTPKNPSRLSSFIFKSIPSKTLQAKIAKTLDKK